MEEEYRVGPGRPPLETRFKPGQSGNPGGLPRGWPKISAALMKILSTEPTQKYPKKNKADEIALALYRKAIKGDVSAIQIILERTEGKTPQTFNVNAAAMPTSVIVERIVAAFSLEGVQESVTRRALLLIGDQDDPEPS